MIRVLSVADLLSEKKDRKWPATSKARVEQLLERTLCSKAEEKRYVEGDNDFRTDETRYRNIY